MIYLCLNRLFLKSNYNELVWIKQKIRLVACVMFLAIDKITGMGKKKKSKHRTWYLTERNYIEVSKNKHVGRSKWVSDEIVMKVYFIATAYIAIVNELANEPFPTPIFHSIHPGPCRHGRRLTCKWVIVRTILSSTVSWILSDAAFWISIAFHFWIRPEQSIRDSLVAKMQIINKQFGYHWHIGFTLTAKGVNINGDIAWRSAS